MLSAQNIAYHYEKQLFLDVSIEINQREIISIMGVSGSGKSTLLHVLSSFLKPQEGCVKLFGQDIYKLSQQSLLQLRRTQIGMIFQAHYLFLGFSAYENLQVASLLANQSIDEEILKHFGIVDVLPLHLGALSGGQQQRLSIARVLTKKPKIIFADEPTGNLDRQSAFEVMDCLFDYVKQSNSILVFVTHDPLLAKRADHAYQLQNLRLSEI